MRIIHLFLRALLGATVILSAVWADPHKGQLAAQDSTSFKVSLPPDWEISSPTGSSLKGQVFRHKGEPNFEVSLAPNRGNPTPTAISLSFECDFVFGAMGSMHQGNLAILRSRPDYFPTEYYSQVILPKNQENVVLFSCLFLGSSSVLLEIRPVPTPSQASVITPLLRAIVDATKTQSTLVYAPGKVLLPRLNVSVAMSQGIWAAGKTMMPPLGETDLLVRTGGPAEMKILPFLSMGSCSAYFAAASRVQPAAGRPGTTTKMRANPPFLSSSWEPTALQFIPVNQGQNQQSLTVCRQLDSTHMLLAVIVYGSEEIPGSDNRHVSASLDEIAQAIVRGPKEDGMLYIPPPVPMPQAPAGGTLGGVSGTGTATSPPAPAGGVIGGVIGGAGNSSARPGVMRISVAGTVQAGHLIKRVEPVYPPLARQTRLGGVVKLHALIDKDGTVVELQVISGHPLLIQSALDAVKQWKYEPTLLNSDPVQVDTEIDVIFSLNQ